MTHTLPHHETERQRSVISIWSCKLGNQGFLRIGAPIRKLLTTFLAKNAMGRRQNTYSKIINVTDRKTSKKRSLAVKYLILIMFNYPTAKTGTVYKSTDGPAGRRADNPPNPDGLGDLHRTVPELTVRVCWQPGPPIWQRFGFDPDPDPTWRSGTVANTIWSPQDIKVLEWQTSASSVATLARTTASDSILPTTPSSHSQLPPELHWCSQRNFMTTLKRSKRIGNGEREKEKGRRRKGEGEREKEK